MLENVFLPLFEVTEDPSSHPELHRFLLRVSGFDSVDDESKFEHSTFERSTSLPADYTEKENPPYNYYLFYMFANICSLNQFRSERDLPTFSLRPNCGEAGGVHHLVAAFLTSESISHGILRHKLPVLDYLFSLSQMGIAMSPKSNNGLFTRFTDSPFPVYLATGLNISLSPDDPLQFHRSTNPLMEEYIMATEQCRNLRAGQELVLQCGFSHEEKRHWLGPEYEEPGVRGNDEFRTDVPDIRVSFRRETLVTDTELTMIFERTRTSARLRLRPNQEAAAPRVVLHPSIPASLTHLMFLSLHVNPRHVSMLPPHYLTMFLPTSVLYSHFDHHIVTFSNFLVQIRFLHSFTFPISSV